MLKVLIVEDEKPALDYMTKLVLDHPKLALAATAANGQEAVELFKKTNFDLVFLDINLPVLSGIEIMEQVEQLPYVIFTTGYDEHAIKAFDLGAIDYLLKPFSEERFNTSVKKALHVLSSGKAEKKSKSKVQGLSFKEKDNYYLLPFADIVYLSSSGKHTVIFTGEEQYEPALLLKDLASKLPEDNFFRIHKQFIVNINYVSRMQYFLGGRYTLYLKDNEETSLPVGKKYALKLKKLLGILE